MVAKQNATAPLSLARYEYARAVFERAFAGENLREVCNQAISDAVLLDVISPRHFYGPAVGAVIIAELVRRLRAGSMGV